jgi:hypothetical protein
MTTKHTRHTRLAHRRHPRFSSGHPGACPPGEGIFLSCSAAPAGPPLNKRRKFEHTRCGGFNLYGHLFPDRLDEIADRMDQAVCAPNVPHD